MAVPVERRMKRWQEQRWILDNIIRAAGIEWDQPRIAYTACTRANVTPSAVLRAAWDPTG